MLLRVSTSHGSLNVLRLCIDESDSVQVHLLKDFDHGSAFRSFQTDVVEDKLELVWTFEAHSETLRADIEHAVEESGERLLLSLTLLSLVLRHCLDLVQDLEVFRLHLRASEHHETVFEEISSMCLEQVLALDKQGNNDIDLTLVKLQDRIHLPFSFTLSN